MQRERVRHRMVGGGVRERGRRMQAGERQPEGGGPGERRRAKRCLEFNITEKFYLKATGREFLERVRKSHQ